MRSHRAHLTHLVQRLPDGANPIVFVLAAVGLLLVLGIAGAAYYLSRPGDADPAPQPVKTKPKKK